MALSVSGFPERHFEEPRANPSSASPPSSSASPPSTSSSLALNSPLLRGLFGNSSGSGNTNSQNTSNGTRKALEAKSPSRSDASESDQYQHQYHPQLLHTVGSSSAHHNLKSVGGTLHTPPSSPPNTSSFSSTTTPLSSSSGHSYESDKYDLHHIHDLQMHLPVPSSLDPPRPYVHPHQLPPGSVKRPQPLPVLSKPAPLSMGIPIPKSIPKPTSQTNSSNSKRTTAASPVRLQTSLVRLEIGKGHGIGHGGQGQTPHSHTPSKSLSSSSTSPKPPAVVVHEWTAASSAGKSGVEGGGHVSGVGDNNAARPLPTLPPPPPPPPAVSSQGTPLSPGGAATDANLRVLSGAEAASPSFSSTSSFVHPPPPPPLPASISANPLSTTLSSPPTSLSASASKRNPQQQEQQANAPVDPSRLTFPPQPQGQVVASTSTPPSTSFAVAPATPNSTSSKPHHQRVPSSNVFLSGPSSTRGGMTLGISHPHPQGHRSHVRKPSLPSLSMRYQPLVIDLKPQSQTTDNGGNASASTSTSASLPRSATTRVGSGKEEMLVTHGGHTRPLPKIPSLTNLRNTSGGFPNAPVASSSSSSSGIASSSSKTATPSSGTGRFIPPPASVRRPRTSPTPSTTRNIEGSGFGTSGTAPNAGNGINNPSSAVGNPAAAAARATFSMWAARPVDLHPAPGQPPALVQSSLSLFPMSTNVVPSPLDASGGGVGSSSSTSMGVAAVAGGSSSNIAGHSHPLPTPPNSAAIQASSSPSSPPVPSSSTSNIYQPPARVPPRTAPSPPPRPPSRQAMQHQRRQEQKRRERERTRTTSQGPRSQPHSRSGSVSSGANVPFVLNPATLASTPVKGGEDNVGGASGARSAVTPSSSEDKVAVKKARREHSVDSFLESYRALKFGTGVKGTQGSQIPVHRTRSTSRTRGESGKIISSPSPTSAGTASAAILGRPRGETVPSQKTSPISGVSATSFIRPRPTLNTTFNLTGYSSQLSPKPVGARSPIIPPRLPVAIRSRTTSTSSSPSNTPPALVSSSTTTSTTGSSPASPTPTVAAGSRPFRALPSPSVTTPIALYPLPLRSATIDSLPGFASGSASVPQSPRLPLSIHTSPVLPSKTPKSLRALPTPTGVVLSSSRPPWAFTPSPSVLNVVSGFSPTEEETRALDVSAPLHSHPVTAFTEADVDDEEDEEEGHAISPIVVGNSTFNDSNEATNTQNKNAKSRTASPYRDPFSDFEDEGDNHTDDNYQQRMIHHLSSDSPESRSPSPIRYARPDSRGNLSSSASSFGRSSSASSVESARSSPSSQKRRRTRTQLRSYRNSYRLPQPTTELEAYPMTSTSNLSHGVEHDQPSRGSGTASAGSGSAPATRYSSPFRRASGGVAGDAGGGEVEEERKGRSRKRRGLAETVSRAFDIEFEFDGKKEKKEDKPKKEKGVEVNRVTTKMKARGGVPPSVSASAGGVPAVTQTVSNEHFVLDISLPQFPSKKKVDKLKSSANSRPGTGDSSSGSGSIGGKAKGGESGGFAPFMWVSRSRPLDQGSYDSPSPSPIPKADVDAHPSKSKHKGTTFLVPPASMNGAEYDLTNKSNRSSNLQDQFDDIVERNAYGAACGLGLLRGTSPPPLGLSSRASSRARAVTTTGASFTRHEAATAGYKARPRSQRRKSKKRTASVPTIALEEMYGALMKGKELEARGVDVDGDGVGGSVRVKRNIKDNQVMADVAYDSDAALLSVTTRRTANDVWDHRQGEQEVDVLDAIPRLKNLKAKSHYQYR